MVPARDFNWQGHVAERGQAWYEMEKLEDDSDSVATDIGQCVAIESGNVDTIKLDGAGIRSFQPGQQNQQRCLAGAGWPDDGDSLTVGDRHVYARKHFE